MFKLSESLLRDGLVAQLQAEDKKHVLKEFAALASRVTQLDEQLVLTTLLNREKLGTTAVGHEVAIPHGKISGLDKIVVLFGRSSKGVAFEAQDQKPTKLFFVILAPEQSASTHLQALARLSRLMKNEQVRELLLSCSEEELLATLIEQDEKLG